MTREPRDLLRGVPVAAVTGINGAGKTLVAVESAIADMKRGRTVYSTVPIRSAYGDSLPIVSLRQLLTLRGCTILLDEVSVIFSSRSSQSLPPEVVAMLHTLRHTGNTVRWTAPDWMRAEVLLRGVTQALLNVVPLIRTQPKDDPWPRPRLIMCGLLDTSTGKIDSPPTRVLRRRFIRPKSLSSWGAYDTHADTPLLGRHLQSGKCPDCGGTRETPKHTRARHDELGLPWIETDEVDAALRASREDALSPVTFAETEDAPA
jgi:hypothetical protein